MIRPFIAKMTKSELHAVMTGGFATIAGSVLGAYIGFGVSTKFLPGLFFIIIIIIIIIITYDFLPGLFYYYYYYYYYYL